MSNIDPKTVLSFGDEWERFDQSGMLPDESLKVFKEYFSVFPWERLPSSPEGFDMGCGSGRWALHVAPRVAKLHCIDPSAALAIARRNLSSLRNIQFHATTVEKSGLSEGSQDFGYSLGVLHHVPNTAAAIESCVGLLKPGAPLLLYLYYSFDNRALWFRMIWRSSDIVRRCIIGLRPGPKLLITNLIALFVYWPLAKASRLFERLGMDVGSVPLSYYRHHSFYTMRTDARDRFGTPLEQRFSRTQIKDMMEKAGLKDITFSSRAPFYCVVGFKA